MVPTVYSDPASLQAAALLRTEQLFMANDRNALTLPALDVLSHPFAISPHQAKKLQSCETPCKDATIQKAMDAWKKAQDPTVGKALREQEVRQVYGLLSETISKQDEFFANTDLLIVPDSATIELPKNVIKESDAAPIKELMRFIQEGKTCLDIQGTLEFRQKVLADLLMLFTRSSSKALIVQLLSQDRKILIQEGAETNSIFFPLTVSINTQQSEHMLVAVRDGDTLISQVEPTWIALAHELLHIKHAIDDTVQLAPADSTYRNWEEIFAITGHPIPSSIDEREFLCENRIRKDFDLPERYGHSGRIFETSELMNTEHLCWAASTGILRDLQIGLSKLKGVADEMQDYGKELFNECLKIIVQSALSGKQWDSLETILSFHQGDLKVLLGEKPSMDLLEDIVAFAEATQRPEVINYLVEAAITA